MKKRFLAIYAFLISISGVSAQPVNEKQILSVESHTLISSGDKVPFWLQMNQLGVFDYSDPFQQLFLLNWNGVPQEPSKDKLQLSYGSSILGRLSEHSAFRFNEYWARLHFKKLYLHAGAKSEPVFANGLSLTNGNLFLSNNARPMPRIGFGTQNFHFSDKGALSKFAFDAEYNEYLLLDDRVADGAHLHHKRLEMNVPIVPSWLFSVGIDHWVFWGGNSPRYGEMPGFEDYFRYILGKSGSSSAPVFDQANVAGNQLGQTLVSLTHNNDEFLLKLYWQHLFEDRSGFQFENAPDGLWGIFFQQKGQYELLESVLFEYTNTRDQSGKYHKYTPDPVNHPDYQIGEGRDDYFNHGFYKSGFVSYNRMIGLPLFIPLIGENGVSEGFPNTRFWGIHNGMNGWLSERISWKTMITYSRHYGKYGQEYSSPKQLFSMLAQLAYSVPKRPLSCALKFAYDHGSVLDSGLGAELQLTYKIQ